MDKIPVGISACLMGEAVRYNGEDNLSRLCRDLLSSEFEFHLYCPEVAIGMGVPREPIRLVGDVTRPRAVGVRDPNLDVTDALTDYGRQIGMQNRHLSGFILTEKSPSCGLQSTKVYDQQGQLQVGRYAGFFARGLSAANPLLPLEESNRLNDPALRADFMARVFEYHRSRIENQR